MDITLYECSKCKTWHHEQSKLRKHLAQSTECAGAAISRKRGRVLFDEAQASAATEQQTKRHKPGPKPFDVEERMSGRIAAFDDGDDERVDYLFDTPGLLDELLDSVTSVHLVAPFMLRVLWGKHAPERFRSFAVYRNCVYEMSGAGCVTNRGPLRKKFVRELTKYILDLVETILTVSLPARQPEKSDRARRLLSQLNMVYIQGITLRDGLERNALYLKYKNQNLSNFVDQVESAMYAAFSRHVWTPYDEH
jgi:hypothetical protein